MDVVLKCDQGWTRRKKKGLQPESRKREGIEGIA